MGIPSYYRRLIKSIEGFYCSRPEQIDRLLMDYNCLIYQVFRDYPAGTGPSWERDFIDEICKYTGMVIETAQVKPDRVFIAMDGIVPLAKMRQQRMRRFRAAALATKDTWDTNAITPGTAFMNNLATSLRTAFPSATISDTGLFGEGEHKLMKYMRSVAEENIAIYGLDGDLFVLGILNKAMFCPNKKIYYLRENQGDTNELIWHSLQALIAGLLNEKSETLSVNEWLKEYSIAMSLLGNDFVPTGLSFRIREGGHERLISYLQRLHSGGLRLCDDDELSVPGFMQLFKWLAADEERFICKTLQQKKNAVMRAKGVFTSEDLPLQMFEECDGRLLNDRDQLVRDWKKLYASIGLCAPVTCELHYLTDSARQYINSLEWTYNYYCKGDESVSFDWMYPYSTAPLFGSVSAIFHGFSGISGSVPSETGDQTPLPAKLEGGSGLKPLVTEQLAIVLPPSSYNLIPKCPQRQLLVKAPWLFPKGDLTYYTFGKRFTWECEAEIPIPTISEVRSILQ